MSDYDLLSNEEILKKLRELRGILNKREEEQHEKIVYVSVYVVNICRIGGHHEETSFFKNMRSAVDYVSHLVDTSPEKSEDLSFYIYREEWDESELGNVEFQDK